MQANHAKRRPGIAVKHRAGCERPPTADEAKCPCKPTFQVTIWLARDDKRLRRNFPSLSEAQAWQIDARAEARSGQLRAPTTLTFAQAAEAWLAAARRGAIRNRSGDVYKPSAIRGYEQALRKRLKPELGPHCLSDVSRGDLQRLIGEWQAGGLNASTIRNTVNAVRVLYRHAEQLTGGAPAGDPTLGLRLPAVRGRRERAASPEEAARLLAALPETDRALWATAFFAGLRHGELRALRWEDVDLAAGVIHVERGWDHIEGEIDPKSASGRRRVPIIARLRELLLEHKILTERAAGLVFGRSDVVPFASSTVNNGAQRAWEAANERAIGLHECRHTFASHLIAAGVHIKAISVYMGHSDVRTTMNIYGHLLPGDETEHGAQLEAFLERADTASRLAQLDTVPTI